MTAPTEETLDQRAERLVRQEVYLCVSALVSTLVSGEVSRGNQLAGLCEKACELAAPVDDWEEAATQAGWETFTGDVWMSPEDNDYTCATAEEVCEREGLEPCQREVFEHWAVSEWLADKLLEQNEKVDKDFEGLCVWARTCSGQGIACDGVIARIVRSLA